jgi:hypothetical protein
MHCCSSWRACGKVSRDAACSCTCCLHLWWCGAVLQGGALQLVYSSVHTCLGLRVLRRVAVLWCAGVVAGWVWRWCGGLAGALVWRCVLLATAISICCTALTTECSR